MSYSDNLSQILKSQNILKNEASAKIGISVNTLSNILNGKVIPSESTKNKILDFIRLLGYSEKDLELDNINLPNLRIRSNSELSGIEKSMLREDLIKIIL
ncbi:helix-turn-helix domain-containing protein, partial [bacterium]|nr:helix-turn-helix domain-containing protein [bacterium]